MTSETKVPMPENVELTAWVGNDGWTEEPVYTTEQVTAYGDARASERDAFWMAKVAELQKVVAEALVIGSDAAQEVANEYHLRMAGYRQYRHAALDADVKKIAEAIDALTTLTNPRAGETA